MRTTYGALVEQIPAIVYQDLADESWTTAYVSPQIREILGVDPSEWTGESKLWLEMLHPDDRQRAVDEVDRGIASGEPYAVEYRMVARGTAEPCGSGTTRRCSTTTTAPPR